MPGAYLFGWDAANGVWVKCLVNAEGKLIIDPSEIFENTPTDNEHGKAPDSDWAYEHDAKMDAHHTKYTDAEAEAAINADVDHGSTAPHNYFSGSHDDLIDVSEADHHAKYTDAEAQSLIDSHAAISGAHHNKDHASRHKDGGADELDAADLAGAMGIAGQVLISDGAAAAWSDPSGGVIPSGTRMLFKNWSAPTGWTFVAEDNDRVILNTNTESEGSNIGGTWQLPNVNGHAISESEMPSHNHSVSVSINSNNANVENYKGGTGGYSSSMQQTDDTSAPTWDSNYIRDTGHSHGASGSAGNTGGNSAHAHSQGNSWRPSYVKVITCQKD